MVRNQLPAQVVNLRASSSPLPITPYEPPFSFAFFKEASPPFFFFFFFPKSATEFLCLFDRASLFFNSPSSRKKMMGDVLMLQDQAAGRKLRILLEIVTDKELEQTGGKGHSPIIDASFALLSVAGFLIKVLNERGCWLSRLSVSCHSIGGARCGIKACLWRSEWKRIQRLGIESSYKRIYLLFELINGCTGNVFLKADLTLTEEKSLLIPLLNPSEKNTLKKKTVKKKKNKDLSLKV